VIDFVPSDQSGFLSKRISKSRWAFKFIKRFSFFVILGQVLFEKKQIPKGVAPLNILWINLSAPSLGDSLMDLGSRVLVANHNIDLLTDKRNIALYENDAIFRRATANVFKCRQWALRRSYDIVFVDAYSPRVLIKKILVSWRAPFCGIYGFLNGFEVHRTYYSFFRVAYLLGLDRVDSPIRPLLSMSEDERCKAIPEASYICIAVGGEWEFRTYAHWEAVIEEIGQKRCVLVGSENGVVEAANLKSRFPELKSFVGDLTLMDTASVINRSTLFVGSDGGLWHVACALSKPSVALFADCSIFDQNKKLHLRQTRDINVSPLYSQSRVSDIRPLDVVACILEKLESV